MLQSLADWRNPNSLGNRLRSRRLEFFERLIAPLPRPVTILDIGGTTAFWEMRGWADRDDLRIVTLNLKAEPQRHPNIEPRSGDATDLSEYSDQSFDVAFSNSVIEHLQTYQNQNAMAREVQRVARAYWVQTPNYWFPVEPHFHVPGWQWMPKPLRVYLLQHRRCGWRGPCPDPARARELVNEVRLMSRRELQRLFPNASMHAERIAGVVKSWVVYEGFSPR